MHAEGGREGGMEGIGEGRSGGVRLGGLGGWELMRGVGRCFRIGSPL